MTIIRVLLRLESQTCLVLTLLSVPHVFAKRPKPPAPEPEPIPVGVTTLASVASDGTPCNSHSSNQALTPDGRYVVFVSAASNLVPGDTNAKDDVFVHDRSARRDRTR